MALRMRSTPDPRRGAGGDSRAPAERAVPCPQGQAELAMDAALDLVLRERVEATEAVAGATPAQPRCRLRPPLGSSCRPASSREEMWRADHASGRTLQPSAAGKR